MRRPLLDGGYIFAGPSRSRRMNSGNCTRPPRTSLPYRPPYSTILFHLPKGFSSRIPAESKHPYRDAVEKFCNQGLEEPGNANRLLRWEGKSAPTRSSQPTRVTQGPPPSPPPIETSLFQLCLPVVLDPRLALPARFSGRPNSQSRVTAITPTLQKRFRRRLFPKAHREPCRSCLVSLQDHKTHNTTPNLHETQNPSTVPQAPAEQPISRKRKEPPSRCIHTTSRQAAILHAVRTSQHRRRATEANQAMSTPAASTTPNPDNRYSSPGTPGSWLSGKFVRFLV